MQGATQSRLVKIINTASFYFKALCLFRRIEAGWSPKALYCLPWPDKKASFHYVHSSYLLTTSNHHITAHYQQPCPLITVHPSTEGEQGQSRFKSNWHTSSINLKMFQLQVGVLSCRGDFTLDILAAEWAVSQCSVAFWGKRDTNFHEGGTRLPKPIASSGQSWTKGTGAEEKGNHWHTGILQQKWKPSAKCVQWRRVEVWGGGEEVEWQSRQTDTKRPCVNAAALRLKIMNTKIICNLSGTQHTRSAPLAAPTILAVCDSDTFWLDVRVFRGFSCMKGVWRSSTATQRASLRVWTVGGKFIALSALPLKACFLYSSISSIFPFTSAVLLSYVSTLSWVTRCTIRNDLLKCRVIGLVNSEATITGAK